MILATLQATASQFIWVPEVLSVLCSKFLKPLGKFVKSLFEVRGAADTKKRKGE